MQMSNAQLTPAVVLVADRTLSARYDVLFEGIFATMQTTKVPEIAMRNFVSPPVPVDSSGRAKTVPLGLRRVQSALLNYTDLTHDDIVCTTPEALPKLLGPWTKIVGVSSSDPLGKGMSNTTTTSFWEGELYTKYWTRQMLELILKAKNKFDFKVVAGGAGTWQYKCHEDKTAQDCIDVFFDGYFESKGPQLFTDILSGRPNDQFVTESSTACQDIQPINDASMLGIVELSRGCGRGCRFCSMSSNKMDHLPPDTILADLETNFANGISSVVSGSEDFFRYGSQSIKPDFDKLASLLEQMQKITGLSFMQIDHANISSVMQLSDQELLEIRKLLTWRKKTDYLWVNMGVESANGNLVAQNCPGKIAPFNPDDWEDLIKQTADKMTRSGFFSVFSIILGLPGETPQDIERTLKLVKYLEKINCVVFPIFYEPLLTEEIKQNINFDVQKMRLDHLNLYRTCYEINFKKVPPLFWDNQRAGGVPWIRRATMNLLGHTEVHAWRKTCRKIDKQLHRGADNWKNNICPTLSK